VINVAAHRISTTEIESVISEVPAVAEVAVVGVPDETKGTAAVACVTLRQGADRARATAAIQDAVVGQIGGYARLGAVYVTSQMPKTRTGKTMRRLVRDFVTNGHAVGDTSALEDPGALDALAVAFRQGG
jgi:acetyl-CoA synthetase